MNELVAAVPWLGKRNPTAARQRPQGRHSNPQRPPKRTHSTIMATNPPLPRRTSMLATRWPRRPLIRWKLALMYRPTRRPNLLPTASLEWTI